MRNYETFSTTADSGIRFRGRDFRELYGNALRGLNLILFGRNPRPRAGETMPSFSVSAATGRRTSWSISWPRCWNWPTAKEKS